MAILYAVRPLDIHAVPHQASQQLATVGDGSDTRIYVKWRFAARFIIARPRLLAGPRARCLGQVRQHSSAGRWNCSSNASSPFQGLLHMTAQMRNAGGYQRRWAGSGRSYRLRHQVLQRWRDIVEAPIKRVKPKLGSLARHVWVKQCLRTYAKGAGGFSPDDVVAVNTTRSSARHGR